MQIVQDLVSHNMALDFTEREIGSQERILNRSSMT